MAEDLTLRLNFPYLLGVYLGVNAVPDCYILIDGPNCVTYKAEHIHGKHDMMSTLLDCRGAHRVVLSGASRDTVSLAREEDLEGLLDAMALREDGGVVVLCALTMCGMISIDYSRILREVNERHKKPTLEVPTETLVHDWLDGYDHLQKGFAMALPMSDRHACRPDQVAIVGHMLDRNEGDAKGNADELRRMLEGIGLEVVSIWLEGQPYAELQHVERAGTIISLPYARTTARYIASRIDATLIETDLPFGLDATCEWLRMLAKELGVSTLAERFIDRELRAIIPRVQWLVPELFVNRRVAFMADPHCMLGLLRIARELGMRCVNAMVFGRPIHHSTELQALAPEAYFVETQEHTWVTSLEQAGELDLIVTNNLGWSIVGNDFGPVMEFGYPSFFHHALTPQPFLGFRGYLALLERLGNRMMLDRMTHGRRGASAPATISGLPPVVEGAGEQDPHAA